MDPTTNKSKKDDALKGLFWSTALFVVIVMIRPQDMFSPLGLVKPGLVSEIWLLISVARLPEIAHRKDPILRCLLLYALLLFLGVIVVVNHAYWFWTLLTVLGYLVAFVVATPILLRSPTYRWKLLAIFLSSFGISALYGILHGGKGPGDWLGDENDMACALSLGFALSAAYATTSGNRPYKKLAISVAVLCAFGVLAAESRGGFLGFAAAALGVAYFSGKFLKALAVVLVSALLIYPLIPADTIKDIASINDAKDETRLERIYSWQKGWEMYVDNPVLGVGVSNYPWRIAQYQKDGFDGKRYWRPLAGRVAHSSYITVLSESGTLGALLYVSVIFMIILRCRKVIYNAQEESGWKKALAAAGGAGMLGAGVSAAFITFCYAPPLYFLAGIAVAIGPYGASKEMEISEIKAT